MTKFLNISTDNTLGGSSASNETVSSQKAIKTYVDGLGTQITKEKSDRIAMDNTLSDRIDDMEDYVYDSLDSFVKTTDTIPITDYSLLDVPVQYKGTTTQDYTNGYFYRSTNPVYSSTVNITTGSFTVTVDNAKFMSRFLKTGSHRFYREDSYYWYNSTTGEVHNLSYYGITITGTVNAGDEFYVNISMSTTVTRIDVQPAGGGGGAVDSVNGQIGTVILDAADVGALPDTTVIPTVDQTYSGTSANAQSGVAVKSAIDTAISSVYKPAGSVTFANKPSLSKSIEGYVYNISDAFTTTNDFVEGAGKSYPAGTNIVCINTATSGTAVYKWDVLSGFVDLSSYALDSNVVHKSGDETVGGTKTFTGNIKFDSTSYSGAAGFLYQQATGQLSIGLYSSDDSSWSNNWLQFEQAGATNIRATTRIVLSGTTPATTNIQPTDDTTSSGQIDTVGARNTKLAGYQATITGGATTITSSNLTASRALISNSSGKVAVSDVTSTELGYLDGVTSAIQTQLNNKQAKIGAGTANNIVAYSGTAGTLNTLTRTTSIRAKASASDTYIPTEKAVATSLEGKYDASNPAGYTSNVGTVTSVNNVSPVNGNVTLSIPSIDNLANKDLSNLSTTGNSKFQAPLVSGTNIKTINNTSILGSGNISIQADPAIDSKSITKNTSNQLQTVGVIDQNNTATALKQWSGTKAQYDAIATKDANTLYNITDDNSQTSFANTDLSNLTQTGLDLFNAKLNRDMSNMNPTADVKKTIVGWGVPDYDSGVAITSPYTPTVDGIIVAQKSSGYSTAEIKFTDGNIIARHQSADSSSSNNYIWAIVKAGKSYTMNAGSITFYPFIGV